ncbi:stationary-phase survival protein SurE [Anaeromyxobacter dehalogenans 2CP-1]|uniref:5'-nucleotidase SurE n=1 Tax=Anaeromyxobacter dehalogenans (strain ATCC BAA-258 / DSM 21875 / 2CP-1) TaxID=455488 RepID=SURE_ANAD2|nr:5'/3'-nucleotidase SurE [Anaeromyxobacter dehalogenans]B8JDR1.1 RecName: Full=5'-nucleotidase SurE; AltName: Full=Nucleoside 5'-monophosphate phosphohydrolase [Anaeromyxobacter dehalogenans 2CP-1]ACL64156.1 stationary-phase survival protein SurE [Anaeromyxobacter dehalogenans 2CP-1]
MRVLLSNDDGVHAAGLKALAEAFHGDEVWVVAPDREQSASSHAISLHRPLRLLEVAPRWYAVDGTPTDAVYMGLNLVLRDARPDVVVSGVNHGPNLGNDVLYSGTVAAAMEGALLGVNAIAVSLAAPPPHDFGEAARFAAALARQVVARPPPAPVLLNVNVPPGPVRGYRFARLGRRTYGNEVVEKTDPRGRKYYWIGGEGRVHNEDIPGSDCNTVLLERLAAVTPLHLDGTHDPMFQELRSWTVPGYEKEPAP